MGAGSASCRGQRRKDTFPVCPCHDEELRTWLHRFGASVPVAMADAEVMRAFLEWLGIVEPDRSRREPVAVPAWAPIVAALVGALLVGAAGTLVTFLVRALLG